MTNPLTHAEILGWLMEEDHGRLDALWRAADATRREHVGDDVHLRGLIEVSSFCRRQCAYCGLRAGNRGLARYRMEMGEITAAARQALSLGFGTVVLQGGEDPGLRKDFVTDTIRAIKAETGLAVTLSLGERSMEELGAWRAAGADRYLLRFETSDRSLFDMIHPGVGRARADRIGALKQIKRLGYETGSGVMVGLPGQTYESLARDIELFRELDLDMIGIGPFIPHKDTPLGQLPAEHELLVQGEVPRGAMMAYKVVALARRMCPHANMPATTALATINKVDGRELALQRGANVVMPNLTPPKYRKLYEIYPDKANVDAVTAGANDALHDMLKRLGRRAGAGPGSARRDAPMPSGRENEEKNLTTNLKEAA